MRFLKVKIIIGQRIFGEFVMKRELITRIPYPPYQDEVDILNKDLSEIKVELSEIKVELL